MTTMEANEPARAQRAMWMTTIRESLERSVPVVADTSFDDLLARLDAIPADAIKRAATRDERRLASLARRDAALEAHLAGHVGRLGGAFRLFYAQLAAPEPSPCR